MQGPCRSSVLAFAACLWIGASSDSASARAPLPAPATVEARVPVSRVLDRAGRAADAVDRVLPQLRAYDAAAPGSAELRERFFESVLECGRAERALRAAAAKARTLVGSESPQSLLLAADAYASFATSLRWLHRDVVTRADPLPALERVTERLATARAQLLEAARPQGLPAAAESTP
jgi:hypothetical protein